MYVCFVFFFSQSRDNRYGLLDLKAINYQSILYNEEIKQNKSTTAFEKISRN